MNLNYQIETKLKEAGADFVHFINITTLSVEENKNYPHAVLFGINLSAEYLRDVMNTPDYVQKRVQNNSDFSDDEFYLTELRTDELADEISQWLINNGYKAYSHSEKNQIVTGFLDKKLKTPLPHKTIASMAGTGWIGKNNLLVTEQFGSAFCLGVVITNAPLALILRHPPQPNCKNCHICVEVCKPKALKGRVWSLNTQREDMLDVSKCTACLNCLVFCPWTQNYIKQEDCKRNGKDK